MQEQDLLRPSQPQSVPPVYLPFTYVPYPSLNPPMSSPPVVPQQPQPQPQVQPRQVFLALPQGNRSIVAPRNVGAEAAWQKAKKWNRVVFCVSLLLIVLFKFHYSFWVFSIL